MATITSSKLKALCSLFEKGSTPSDSEVSATLVDMDVAPTAANIAALQNALRGGASSPQRPQPPPTSNLNQNQNQVKPAAAAAESASVQPKYDKIPTKSLTQDLVVPDWYLEMIQDEASKPLDCSDVNSLEKARVELSMLRKQAGTLKETIEKQHSLNTEEKEAVALLRSALALRPKWLKFQIDKAATAAVVAGKAKFELQRGVLTIVGTGGVVLAQPPPMAEFMKDYDSLVATRGHGTAKSYCKRQLETLEHSFSLFVTNHSAEEQSGIISDAQDFYSIHKVDNHIHAAAAMPAAQLVRYMKECYYKEPDRVVDDKGTTLKKLIDTMGINIDFLTVDQLEVQATELFMDRFDLFNESYNIMGKRDLRKLFMKPLNFLEGEYFSELLKNMCQSQNNDHVHMELRVSIGGDSRKEWGMLANWYVKNKMEDPLHNWIIQVPRTYSIDRKKNVVKNFAEVLRNIFEPLIEVSLNPQGQDNLVILLENISGFDSVNDESIQEPDFENIPPEEYTSEDEPPYAYWCYYMAVNIQMVNAIRSSKGLNVFDFRPHCGESGSPDHLAAGFMLAHGVNHGINLSKSYVYEYLYYLTQIGCAVSPCSNNALFLPYSKNPFLTFFNRGLNVTLSTDDPLQFHLSEQPLLEEYAIARIAWSFSVTDLSELARNSVMQSGFNHKLIQQWLGANYLLPGAAGNEVNKSNLPDIRLNFRHQLIAKHLNRLGLTWENTVAANRFIQY